MLTTELTKRGLALQVMAKPDGSVMLHVGPRDRITNDIHQFAKTHKPEILHELFDIGVAATCKCLVKCSSCGSPARLWQNQNANNGEYVTWWICEDCGRIHRDRPVTP